MRTESWRLRVKARVALRLAETACQKCNRRKLFSGELIMATTSAEQKVSSSFIQNVRSRVSQVVVGQDTVVERLLIALFTGGHLLLQGMPGLAKTLLVNAIARA